MTSLFVDRRGVELKLDGEALVFAENGERVGTVPLMPLSRVYLRGDVKLTACLLGKAGRGRFYAAFETRAELFRRQLAEGIDDVVQVLQGRAEAA